MIRLTKKEIPPVLKQNSVAWTQTLLDHTIAGTEPTDTEKSHYRHPEIKAALVVETAGKCAYCESKLRHIAYGDVEHITPKSGKPEKTFEWENLTLACDICNTNKGVSEDIIDPYIVDPSEHLNFVGAIVLPNPGSCPGLVTQKILELNRMDLVERRTERLTSLNMILYLLVVVADQKIKAVLRKDLEGQELSRDKEFAAMAQAFVADQLRQIDDAALLHQVSVGAITGNV